MKNLHLFIVLLFLNVILTISIKFLFLDENLYYLTFGNQLPAHRIDEMLEISRKWQWTGYAIIPVIILLRAFYTSLFLYIGLFFADIRAGFGKLFRIALLADFVYGLAGFVKLVILIFFREVPTLDDLQFQPFSVMELFGNSQVDPLFIFPLSLLNLFELAYFLILAWQIKGLIRHAVPENPSGFAKSLRLVTASYGSGLLLWIILVMFVTLNLS
jgi:hypothetical protein